MINKNEDFFKSYGLNSYEWLDFFSSFKNIDYLNNLNEHLENEYKQFTIYPKRTEIFNAFNLTEYSKVKVIIIGQDPYHNEGQANGLAFSVNKGISLPKSLKNIYKELKNDLDIPISNSGDLSSWAKQGVLLLNSSLTVRENRPNSHLYLNWEILTNYVINNLSLLKEKLVFILWGNYAIKKKNLIIPKHLILETSHPSPFSCHRGFFGCKHFSKSNKFLIENGNTIINYVVEN